MVFQSKMMEMLVADHLVEFDLRKLKYYFASSIFVCCFKFFAPSYGL